MSVELDIDNVIEFERPLTRIVKKTITISNPHSEPLAFKVKTTAPKLYCVRPNSEIIPPKQSLEVQIILQALKKEPEPGYRCKDKFLILSILVDEQLEGLSLADLWSRVEGQMKSSLSERKLRCNFVDPVVVEPPVPVAAPPPAAANAPEVTATTTTTTTPATEKQVESSSIDRSEELANEKLKQMQAELEKYKTEAETLRQTETVTKKPQNYYSIAILFALLAIAVFYFSTK